jgi:hypothetical protein
MMQILGFKAMLGTKHLNRLFKHFAIRKFHSDFLWYR